jgi:CHAD domain-containing protein
MPFRIKAKRSLEKNLRRMVESQAEKASEALRGKSERTVPEVVHDVRKRFKRIRALARLSRKVLGTEVANDLNRRFRDAARPLSELRDAEVLIQTLDDLAGRWSPSDRPEVLSALRERLENREEVTRRQVVEEEDRFSMVLDAVSKALREFKRAEFAREHWGALADGFTRNYSKCLSALEKVRDQPSDENLHSWRKRVKDLLYEARILRPVRP